MAAPADMGPATYASAMARPYTVSHRAGLLPPPPVEKRLSPAPWLVASLGFAWIGWLMIGSAEVSTIVGMAVAHTVLWIAGARWVRGLLFSFLAWLVAFAELLVWAIAVVMVTFQPVA